MSSKKAGSGTEAEPRTEDPWKRLGDFDGLSREEKTDIFDEIRKDNPDLIEHWYHLAGYDFFVLDGKALRKGGQIPQLQESLEYSYNHAVFRAEDQNEREKAGRDAVRRDLRPVRDEIMSEYKIHLQPERRHIGEAVRRLLDMMRDGKNADLRSNISAFKIQTSPDQGKEDIFPEIVIYTGTGARTDTAGKSEGRRNMERALAAVAEAMRGLEPIGQKDRAPRFNAKINELIYVAQSGGDFKKFLKRIGLLGEFFDDSSNYGFQRGEKPPTLGSNVESRPPAVTDQDVEKLEQYHAKIIRSRAAGVHNFQFIRHTIQAIDKNIANLRTEIKDLGDQGLGADAESAADLHAKQKPLKNLRARLQRMRDELIKYDRK